MTSNAARLCGLRSPATGRRHPPTLPACRRTSEKTRKKAAPGTWRQVGVALHSACRGGSPGTQPPITNGTIITMAKKKAASKKAAPKAAKPAAAKPIKDVLSKSGLVAHISESTGVAARDVRAVMSSLESTVHASVNKKGAGAFTLPGLRKITVVNVPAKPKRKGVNPF